MDPATLALITAAIEGIKAISATVDVLAAGSDDPDLQAKVATMKAHIQNANDLWEQAAAP